MKFEFYVLNYDCNAHKVINFNVFRNINVQECTEKAIRKYLRSPKNYKYIKFGSSINGGDDVILYGFEALCKDIESIIKWQEWGRREYEISVSDAFEKDINNFEKWDCYMQCKPNIEIIVRECIYQYKKQVKEQENGNNE